MRIYEDGRDFTRYVRAELVDVDGVPAVCIHAVVGDQQEDFVLPAVLASLFGREVQELAMSAYGQDVLRTLKKPGHPG